MSNVNTNYTDVFTSMGIGTSGNENAFSLTDYMSIKNGSYGKLLKAYYKKQDADKTTVESESEKKQLSLLKSSADKLKNSTLELMDEDLFEKKTIKTKDEATGEETEKEDYDWDAITKAVKAFAEDYNSVIKSAGESDNKGVLRNASWMTQMTESNAKLLESVGITIDSDNSLKVDEEALKKANISTLKLVFQGVNSFADKVVRKAAQIGTAAVQGTSGNGSAYTNTADYENLMSGGYLYDETF
ncbi:MAG: hypothetical protein ACI4AA_05830 [Lachnospiraceae bacterium]